MSKQLLVALPGNADMAASLAQGLGAEVGHLEVRRFPDGESYIRYDQPVEERSVILVCTLDDPDEKFLPLAFAAEAALELGAKEAGLVAPYLAYMRQDRRFEAGEAITSIYFARLLSQQIDWLVTVDPHLHRRESLGEIYGVPAKALTAMPAISEWISREIDCPVLIGPDEESEQWVATAAARIEAPHMVLRKIRRGDRDVEISVPDIELCRKCTPILMDDIISTGRTMLATIRILTRAGARPPVCVAVHGIFADAAYQELLRAGAAQVVTTNTIPHESNQIDITGILCEGVGAVTASMPSEAGIA